MSRFEAANHKQGRHAAAPHLMRSACCATICSIGESVSARPDALAGVLGGGEERRGVAVVQVKQGASAASSTRRAARCTPTRMRRRPPAPPVAPPWCADFLPPAPRYIRGCCELSEARNNYFGQR